MDISVSLPGGGSVVALQQRARFYKNDMGFPFVEISAIGSKDTVIQKVKPEHMAMFRAEWDAFCDGEPMAQRPGTALTDVPGINADKAEHYVQRNVHNAEELAVLSDGQCQALGHGTLTDRKSAQAHVHAKKMQAELKQRDTIAKASATVRTIPDEPDAMKEVSAKLDKIADLLLAMAQQKKPGRPKKTDGAV